MAIDLTGQRIAVVGAAGGIGTACAHLMARLGADLILNDIANLSSLASTITAAHSVSVTVSSANPATADGAKELAEEAGDLDALVYLAGICPMDDWLSDPEWERVFFDVMRVNVFGSFALVRSVMPAMARRGHGRIVIVGSSAARSGGIPTNIQPHYVASKGALHSFVRHLARRAVPHGVLVNGVAPGAIETGMNANMTHRPENYPMRRMGRAEEVAWPIAFLCSPAASYICGAILDVNGGTFIG